MNDKRGHTFHTGQESSSASASRTVNVVVLPSFVGDEGFCKCECGSHCGYLSQIRSCQPPRSICPMDDNILKNPIVPPVLVKTPIAPCEWFPRAFWMLLRRRPTAPACRPTLVAWSRVDFGSYASGVSDMVAPKLERR